VPGLLPGRKTDVVTSVHFIRFGTDAHGERALKDVDMLFLEDVIMRGRALLARTQFLDCVADAIVFADRGEGQVPVAQGEARSLGPFLPRDVERGNRLWRRNFLCRHLPAAS
jgi:hypothetical protein